MKVIVPEQILEQEPTRTYRDIMALLDDAGPDDDDWFARWWAADALTLMGDYSAAISIYPPPTSSRASMQVERLLSLKIVAGQPYGASDVLALLGPFVTKFGREKVELVRAATRVLVESEDDDERLRRLHEWAKLSPQRPYTVYIGAAAGYHASKGLSQTHYRFSQEYSAMSYCRSIARGAENMVREDAGIPRVGEGWVSETKLFYEICDAFPDLTVQQHASPPWLGRQHLDVYIPELAVAVEYQGPQHDRPVDFFGGLKAYEATKKRDARKRRLCNRHGINLIYVRPGYELSRVEAAIRGSTEQTPG